MAKIISRKWLDKEGPVFTGRFTNSSHRKNLGGNLLLEGPDI